MAEATIEEIRAELFRCAQEIAAEFNWPVEAFVPLVSHSRSPTESNRYFSPALLRYRNFLAREKTGALLPSLGELAERVAALWSIDSISCAPHNNGYITFEDITKPKVTPKMTGGVLDEKVDVLVIGDVVESTYHHKWGTPRQGGFAKGSTTCIKMRQGFGLPEEIRTGDFCIVLWACHLNETNHNHLKAKARPPKNNGEKVGVFACRSPYRPTNMGMSICRVAEIVAGGMIEMHDCDMILGTPILSLEKYTAVRHRPTGEVRMPRYVTESAGQAMKVCFSNGARQEIKKWPEEMEGVIVNTLEEDPRSIHSRKKHKNPVYAVDIGCEGRGAMRVVYRYKAGEHEGIRLDTNATRCQFTRKRNAHSGWSWLEVEIEKGALPRTVKLQCPKTEEMPSFFIKLNEPRTTLRDHIAGLYTLNKTDISSYIQYSLPIESWESSPFAEANQTAFLDEKRVLDSKMGELGYTARPEQKLLHTWDLAALGERGKNVKKQLERACRAYGDALKAAVDTVDGLCQMYYATIRAIGVGGGALCEDSVGKQVFGYTVTSSTNKYFHAYINADKVTQSTPTFVYLPGGPGISALGVTLTMNGPCIIETDDFTLSLNKYSWTSTANGIYIDAPGKTGFSVGSTETTIKQYIETCSTATLLAKKIVSLKAQSGIKLKSLLVIDGAMGLLDMYRDGVEMAKDRKLLPEKVIAKMVTDGYTCAEKVKACQPSASSEPNPQACQDAMIFCGDALLNPLDASHISRYDVRVPPGAEARNYKLITGNSEMHMNEKSIQTAMGVNKPWFSSDSQVFNDFRKYGAFDTTNVISELLDNGLKVTVFNGDQDFVCNSRGALYWMSRLKGKIDYGTALAKAPVKPLKFKQGGPLGTIKQATYSTGGSLAFIEVTDGSHTPMLNKPLEMLQAIQQFVQ
ncbi:hypothetical protein FOL47_004056 [Perkinsus chesapeaki]|uniref:TsaA-like domain-containing protein n=1 Tax=Perkinsus chesapeaki TaxID=330153 RepID=A0A7J6M512_PERCH|nr:hypothetical protein FOL47_004056 [Perkinsus chesapeaki]